MNEEFFRGYYEAYNSEQEARLREFLAEDLLLVSAEGEERGIDAYLKTYRYITDNFHDRMTPEEIRIDGDTATVDIIDHFTAKKDVPDFLGRVFEKGQDFTLSLRGTYLVRDGKIVKIEIQILGVA